MLTEKQLAHFRTFGFVILKDLFTQEEVETLNAEFDNACERASSYDPFDGSKRHIFRFRGEDGPFFASLMEDPRFASTAEQLYGEDVFATGCSGGIRFVNKGTKWHPDTVNKNQYGIKFGFYLQPLRADSGALRVIPGSHQNPLHSDLREGTGETEAGRFSPGQAGPGRGWRTFPRTRARPTPEMFLRSTFVSGTRAGAGSKTGRCARPFSTTIPRVQKRWKQRGGSWS